MKDSFDSTAVGRAPAPEPEGFTARKLIRPSLNQAAAAAPRPEPTTERRERPERSERPAGGKKTPPSEQTHAENFYYQKQIQTHTPLVVVLQDGEAVHGYLEWYDKTCIKLNRNGQPNLLIYKPSIKYMYKESEVRGNGK